MSSPRLNQKSIPYLIRGKVFDLLLLKNSDLSVELDMQYYNPESKTIPWENFRINLPSRFELEEIIPSPAKDFYIETDMLISRSIPVKLTFQNEEVRSHFTERGFSYTPKLVELTGSESVLDKLQRVETEPISNENLISDFTTVRLELLRENVIMSTSEITITKPEKDIISKTFSLVPVHTKEKEHCIPKWVSVRVIGSKTMIDTLNVNDIEVTTIQSNRKDGFRLLDIKLPAELMLLEYSPEKVQVIESK
jgi:hypothetical protein